jgi:hypothetical protein
VAYFTDIFSILQCDEKSPSCSACARLELICEYPRRSPAQPPTILTPARTQSDPALRPQTQELLWTTGDLELLHHYTTCCCVFVPGEHRRQLWTQQIVNVAFTQDYLLYQILAVGALHCFHQNPSRQDLAAKAVKYRGQALQNVNPTLANMTADLCIPVFAFAGLSMVYAFAELVILRESEGQDYDPIHHITECLQQNFGITTVVTTYREDIRDSWASELINMNSDEEFDRLSASGLVFAQAAMLHSLIDSHETRPAWNTACHEALTALLQTLQILLWRQEDHFTFHLINAWPSKLKPKFWQLLAAKAPVALLVLAYFAVAMSLRPKLWWFQHWPKLLLERIEERLGDEWREALAWPKQVVDAPPVVPQA